MDYGDYYSVLYKNYYGDPFPHSLLSTRQLFASVRAPVELLGPRPGAILVEETRPGLGLHSF